MAWQTAFTGARKHKTTCAAAPEGRHLSSGRKKKFQRCCRNSSENLCGSSCCRPIGALGITRRIPSITHLHLTSGARNTVGWEEAQSQHGQKLKKSLTAWSRFLSKNKRQIIVPVSVRQIGVWKIFSDFWPKNHDFFNFEGEGLLLELQLSSFHSPVKWKRGTLMLDQ